MNSQRIVDVSGVMGTKLDFKDYQGDVPLRYFLHYFKNTRIERIKTKKFTIANIFESFVNHS